MAFLGLFGNYDKPGPGVNKDDPQKTAPVRFFEILGRKFTKLIQINLIFLIPFVLALVLGFLIYLFPQHFILQIPVGTTVFQLDIWGMYAAPIPFILLVPFSAGLTFVTRNFVREEHAFVWSDFWKTVRENWKYFLINGAIVYLVYVVLSFSLIYYYTNMASQGFFLVLFAICIIFGVLFLFAQFYLPIMFVTFDLKFTQAYKNAFIFSLAGLWRNLLITIILGGLLFLCFSVIPIMPLTVLIFLAFVVFLVFSLVSYFINFTVYPVIDRYLIQPYQQRQEEEKNGGIEQPSTPAEKSFSGLFSSGEEDEEEGEEDKFVYVNGRLIKQSELKSHHDK